MKEIMDCVKEGEEIHITQNGEVVAAMLHPSNLRHRVRTPNTIAAEKLLREFKEMQKNPPDLSDIGEGISSERAEQLVREIRTERDSY